MNENGASDWRKKRNTSEGDLPEFLTMTDPQRIDLAAKVRKRIGEKAAQGQTIRQLALGGIAMRRRYGSIF